jgi:phosphorylase kinase alpha/beta subunit
VCIERLVHAGNKIFLDDQQQILGETTLCCAKPKEQRELTPTGTLFCEDNNREQLMFVNIFMTVF